jgi:outer membrane protein OmpA-like peptidoglycan-associated protein
MYPQYAPPPYDDEPQYPEPAYVEAPPPAVVPWPMTATAQPAMAEPPPTSEPAARPRAPDQPTAGEYYIEPETFESDPEFDEYQSGEGEFAGGFGEYEQDGRRYDTGGRACPPYLPGEVAQSKTEAGHLPSDFIQHPRGTLIADFGVDWRHTKPGLARNGALRSWLTSVIAAMRADSSFGITISGYSDCVGRENNNRFLRRGRALRVKQLLLRLAGADASFLRSRIPSADPAPPDDYVADNGTIEGRAQNRGALIRHITLMPPMIVTGRVH